MFPLNLLVIYFGVLQEVYMKYVLYFGFWIAVFYAVIRFGLSVIEDQGDKGSPEEK